MNMQGAGVHVSPMHIQQPQNTPPQNTYVSKLGDTGAGNF